MKPKNIIKALLSLPLLYSAHTDARILFCFDFDETITNVHTYKYLSGAACQDEETIISKTNELVDKYGIKNKALLLKTFKRILSSKNKIAITSYNHYLSSIKATLIKTGLTSKEIAKIYFSDATCHLPRYKNKIHSDDGTWDHNIGKNYHIKKALEYFKEIEFTKIVLVDDSKSNIMNLNDKINSIPAVGILVPSGVNPEDKYLYEALEHIDNYAST